MLPHAPLRRVFFVTLSGILLVGWLTYAEHGVFVAGALMGGSIGATLTSLEIFVLRRNAGAFFRRLPFLPYLGLRVLLYAGVILLVNAVMNWLITPDGLVINMSRADIVFTLVICVCTILLLGINDLLGPGALFAFVAGRYYHPPPRGARFALHRHALLNRESPILICLDSADTARAEMGAEGRTVPRRSGRAPRQLFNVVLLGRRRKVVDHARPALPRGHFAFGRGPRIPVVSRVAPRKVLCYATAAFGVGPARAQFREAESSRIPGVGEARRASPEAFGAF